MSQDDLCHQPGTAQSSSAEIVRVYQHTCCRGFCQSSGRAGAGAGAGSGCSAPRARNAPHCQNAEQQLALVNRHSPGQEIRASFCHMRLLSHVLSASSFLTLDTFGTGKIPLLLPDSQSSKNAQSIALPSVCSVGNFLIWMWFIT